MAVDLGSGAGLPGLVVAIAVPSLSVTLAEVRQRRAAFLEFAVEQLGVANVTVAARRLEDLTGEVDLCFARAFAPLPQAWTVAERLLGPGGRLVYFAGSGSDAPPGALGATVLEVREAPLLESAGPLVIMAR
jgi:16S rRNA (guanine527-N7)-methyltransferase